MLELLLVALIVLGATLYAAWRLWPTRGRLALLRRLDTPAREGSIVHRLRLRAEAASGCDACAGAPSTDGNRR